MNKYYYDFHIHSCLSPCADDDMTPGNIVGMAKLNNLDIIALTDHNSCKNTAVCEKFAKEYDVVFVPGAEVTTSEEVHVVCLFPTVDKAVEFDKMLYDTIPDIKNKPEIFGNQFVIDESDEISDRHSKLLVVASGISISEIEQIVAEYGGFCFPAHVDRSSNSVISNLGMIPQGCLFPVVEVKDKDRFKSPEYDTLRDKVVFTNSDAHSLHKISECENYIRADKEIKTASDVIEVLKNSG